MTDIIPPNSPLRKKGPAPSIYCTMFSRDQNTIYAGGAGANEMRAFDYHSGNLLFKLTDMDRAIISLDLSYNGKSMVFGSQDATMRIVDFCVPPPGGIPDVPVQPRPEEMEDDESV